MGPGALQHLRQRLAREIVRIGQDRLEAALHVQAVIAIADGAVELRQLLGMIDHRGGRRGDQAPLQDRIESHLLAHAFTRLPPASKKSGRTTSMATASPTWRPASGSA